MTKLKSLEFEGITIPVNTPCKAMSEGVPSLTRGVVGDRGIQRLVSLTCQIIVQKDHCAAGEIEEAYCTTCGEVVYQKIHR